MGTDRPLERTLPIEYTSGLTDDFVRLDGIVIDDSDAAVMLTNVGSGLCIYFVTLYLLKDEQWELSYRYVEPISLTSAIREVRLNGLNLFLKANAQRSPWESTIPLPGNVGYVDSG